MKASKKELFYNEFSDQWERRINDFETNKRIRIVFGQLLRGISLKGKKFLEVGCGLGYFSERASMLGARVTGVDIGKRLVEKCSERVPLAKFVVASASKLPFKDKSFDIVLCTEVIEHVENQSKAIKELARVLKEKGHLVLTTPNKLYWPFFNLLSLTHIRPYQGIEKWFFPREITSNFKRVGLSIVKRIYFNFMINQGYLLRKSL